MGGGSGFPPGIIELLRDSDLGEGGAYLAWQLGRLARDLASDDRDTFVLLVGRLLAAQAAGSTRLPIDGKDHALLARASELVSERGSLHPTPLVLDDGCLYTQRAHACEVRVALRLAARLTPGPFSKKAIARAVKEAATRALPKPSAEQRAAIASALGTRLGVISGGPGTGKTTTALLLVRSLARLGVPVTGIALAAPTGKAKSRLEDDFRTRLAALPDPPPVDRELLARCPPARTLHHLLGATGEPGAFRHHTRNPLPLHAVVVDECSMIDLALMDRLLDALPASCQLVLLGDAEQLPSVSAGAVFRDLTEHAVRLSRPFRSDPAHAAGSQLLDMADAVRRGDVSRSLAIVAQRQEPGQLAREGVEHLHARNREELLRQHHARPPLASVGQLGRVFDVRNGRFAPEDAVLLDALTMRSARARILCVTRRGEAGVEQSNAFLHRLAGGGAGLLPGEPVLMLRNDYQRELWNGDQGIAVRVRESGRSVVVAAAFHSREGWLAVDTRAVGSALALGYALTVHKAQGSEYDEVLLLLPDEPCPLLTRELLYTALSRARLSVVLCGDPTVLEAGIGNVEKRTSGLTRRLASARPPP